MLHRHVIIKVRGVLTVPGEAGSPRGRRARRPTETAECTTSWRNYWTLHREGKGGREGAGGVEVKILLSLVTAHLSLS